MATARRLTTSEKSAISSWLTVETEAIFFAQAEVDQRHGYHAALTVIASDVHDRDVIVAALLHDVGKRHSRLGIIGRSLASLLILAGLPLTERMRVYRDHGLVAARELAAVGAPAVAIDFAMHHHRARPPTIDPATWDVLVAADQPPKARPMQGPRITSTRK